MLILKISDPATLTADTRALDSLMNDNGIVSRYVNPSSMSFLTSMRIATECKSSMPDAVLVFRLKDAVGAISARELVRGRGGDFRIVYVVNPKDPLPKRISGSVKSGIDIWAFPDTECFDRYATLLPLGEANSAILAPTTVAEPIEAQETSLKTIVRVGPIDDTSTLATAIEVMTRQQPEGFEGLRVLGTGQARYVMPLVKRARANGLAISWLGDDYDVEKELTTAGAILVADPATLSPVELRAMAAGIPLLRSRADIEEYLDPKYDGALSTASLRNWDNRHRPDIYIDTLKRIVRP